MPEPLHPIIPMTGFPARAPVLLTARLKLEPLRVDHAAEMAERLDDPRLHRFMGGRPADVPMLRARYARQVAGRSADGGALWFNWVVRERSAGRAVGTMQATVTAWSGATPAAELAWVIATASQRRGYAREAGAAMAEWLRGRGVRTITARIHPDHAASAAVARALGLVMTGAVADGEMLWSD